MPANLEYSAVATEWEKVSFHSNPKEGQDTGCLGLVHWDDPEGWYGEGGAGWGTRVHLWWIHVDVWQNQYNIVK